MYLGRHVQFGAHRCSLKKVVATTPPAPNLVYWNLGWRTLSSKSGHGWDVKILDGSIEVTSPYRQDMTRRTSLPNFWLRDNCRCSTCVNQDTGQRNFDTFELARNVSAQQALADFSGLVVTWSGDGHRSHYPWDFITLYQDHNRPPPEQVSYRHWGSGIQDRLPTIDHSTVMDTSSDIGVGKLTCMIREYGFAFVSSCPKDRPNATKELLERIAFIRVTHYGGFYDFIPDLALADTAYTNLALSAHTDTTYFSDPAGLQCFHLLSHTAPHGSKLDEGRAGGESLLVDGFHAAQVLKTEDRRAYDVLTKVRLPWHASGNKGINMAPHAPYPVIELDEETHKLFRVRWNNDDRGIVPFTTDISPNDWYEAAFKWHSILTRPHMQLWTQLEPGKPLSKTNLFTRL